MQGVDLGIILYCAQQGANVTGIDISETMIKFARKEAIEDGIEVEFVAQDTTDMNAFSDNTFDMVISSIATHFGMTEFFQETSRVLKTNGVFCFSEVHPILDGGIGRGKALTPVGWWIVISTGRYEP